MVKPDSLQALCSLNQFHIARKRASYAGAYPAELHQVFSPDLMREAQEEIRSWNDYTPTDLHSLQEIARTARVASVLYKDESSRFGLGSFKALGGAYAVLRLIAKELSRKSNEAVSMQSIRLGEWKALAANITVATATDGNHGRSVAWGAKQAGCKCRIYIHRDVSTARASAMAELGAEVIRVDGDYDESVRCCAKEAKAAGWQVVSDTSWPGYQEVPTYVMAGYTLMVREVLEQCAEPPSHVIIQAGVGGLASSVAAAFWAALEEQVPTFMVVESDFAPCILESLKTSKAAQVSIEQETLMAGLSCGETSLIAWDILSRCLCAAGSISDAAVPQAMRCLANGSAVSLTNAQPIEAGECAVPGVIALLALCRDDQQRIALELDESSRVLVFGCEGATDPAIYKQLLDGSPT